MIKEWGEGSLPGTFGPSVTRKRLLSFGSGPKWLRSVLYPSAEVNPTKSFRASKATFGFIYCFEKKKRRKG